MEDFKQSKRKSRGFASAQGPDAPPKRTRARDAMGSDAEADAAFLGGPSSSAVGGVDDWEMSPELSGALGVEHGGDHGGPPEGDGGHAVPETDFKYSIEPGTYEGFAPAVAPMRNLTASTQPVAEPKADGPAYVGNVPTVGRGKDKPPVAVANQYADEAFDHPADVSARFALVVGVNRKESVLRPQAEQVAALTELVAGVQAFDRFPLASEAHLWRPLWIDDDTGAPADFEDVRAAAALDPAGAQGAEAEGKPMIPAGEARNRVAQAPATSAFVAHLGERFEQTYVHVGDPDAVNLKAKATADAPAATGLFDRYDQVLADHANPVLVSGGYHFQQEGIGDDPHAGAARKGVAQTVATNQLDMRVRHAVGAVNAAVSYMPEPNLLIRADQIGHADFGKGALETRRLVEAMSAANHPEQVDRSPEWAKQNMVFDTRAGLYTDAGRFDDNYTDDPSYAGGAVNPKGLFNQKRAAQSHAAKRQLINQIKWFYKGSTGKQIFPIMELYLPQELFALTDDVSGAKLEEMKESLQAFSGAIEAIDGYVRAEVMRVGKMVGKPSKNNTEVADALVGLLGGPVEKRVVDAVHAAIADARKLGPEWTDVLDLAKAAGKAIAAYLSEFHAVEAVADAGDAADDV